MRYSEFLALKEALGEPLRMVVTKEGAQQLFFNPIGTGCTGTAQQYTIPADGTYTLVAQGAAGSLGTNERLSSGTVYDAIPGRGGRVTADFALNAGDELIIYVGQKGTNVRSAVNDGTSGGSGGGTFVFRKIPAITDNRYQVTHPTYGPLECLMVAAGGGGTQDCAYRQAAVNGQDAANIVYSLQNFAAFSTTTASVTGSASVGNVLSLSHLILRDGQGAYYLRSSNYGYGGFGCGSATDDNCSYAGGWCKGSVNYSAASWARDGGSFEVVATEEEGAFEIGITAPVLVEAFWQPVFDRTLADCQYGIRKGCMDWIFWNRVESNKNYLHTVYLARANQARNQKLPGYPVDREYYIRLGAYNNLKKSVQRLRDAFGCSPPGIPIPMTDPLSFITYEEANHLEKSMLDLLELIERVEKYEYCVNDAYCGNYLFGGGGV